MAHSQVPNRIREKRSTAAPRRRQKICAAVKKPGNGFEVFKDVQQWIMDTGSGVDLVPRKEVEHASQFFTNSDVATDFFTANGGTSTTEVIKATMPPLREQIQPYVLNETPAVLSVGLRCRQFGYSFHWFAHKKPFIVTQRTREKPFSRATYRDRRKGLVFC